MTAIPVNRVSKTTKPHPDILVLEEGEIVRVERGMNYELYNVIGWVKDGDVVEGVYSEKGDAS